MDLSDQEIHLILGRLSKSLPLDLEKILALYSYLQDDLFFVVDVLAGCTIKFPQKSVTKSILNFLYKKHENYEDIRVVDMKDMYVVNGKWTSAKLIKNGDLIQNASDGREYVALSNSNYQPEHNYIVLGLPKRKQKIKLP